MTHEAVTPAMIERAAKVAEERITPYDAWYYDTPKELAEAMLRAALEAPDGESACRS